MKVVIHQILKDRTILFYFIALAIYLLATAFVFVGESVLKFSILTLIFAGFLLATLGVAVIYRFVFCVAVKIKSSNLDSMYLLNKNQSIDGAMFNLIDDFSEAISRRDGAELLKVKAELDAMQSQINPHFLYNTLDSIRNRAIEDGSDTTAQMIETLSSLFRYTISQKDELKTIYQELKNVENYINIQQYRFSNRYTLKLEIDDTDNIIYDYQIPKLTLQPIIENCIYHGLREKEEDCVITIRAYTTQSTLVIVLSDNGMGMSHAQLQELNSRFASNEYGSSRSPSKSEKGRGIALTNVNARIRLMYGERYGLTAYSARDVGTDIYITLPIKSSEANI